MWPWVRRLFTGAGTGTDPYRLPTHTHGATGDNDATVPNPVLIGLKQRTALTAGSNGRNMSWMGTVVGAGVVRPYSIPESDFQAAGASGGLTTTTAVAIRAAGASGIRNYLTGLALANNSATATEVVVLDNATVIWRGFLAAGASLVAIPFPTPLRGTAANAMNIRAETAGAAVVWSAQGYQAP